MPPRYRALGTFEVFDGGRRLDLGGPRQRSVLARLLMARGRVVAADTLVEDLWRGEPPPKAAGALQAYVSHLRRALEPDRPPRAAARLLVSAPPGYAMRAEADDVDAWRFDDLVRAAGGLLADDPSGAETVLADALALWQGAAYAEFAADEWAVAEASRLEELRTVAIEMRAQAGLALGRAAAVVPDLEAYVATHPLREDAWRLLALALYRTGRQADALAALRRVRARLADDLGVDPGPALQRLEADVLAQSSALDHVPLAARPVHLNGRAGHLKGTNGRARWLVGREQEMRVLEEAAAAVESGAGGLALVAGEAGAGKTALVDRLADRLGARGWRVAWGGCPESEGAPAAWPWSEVLRRVVAASAPTPDEEALLAPLLVPTLAPVAVNGGGGDMLARRFRMHQAVTGYLARAAGEAPLLLAFDDLHRADDETLTLLTSVADGLGGCRVLVVAAYRPDESPEALATTMATLARHGPSRLTLRGLAEDDVAEVVRDVTGTDVDPRTARTIADRTDGNPFYVVETARLLASERVLGDDVPAGVRDVIRRRVARLPGTARSVLALAAVVGRDVDVDVLLAAAVSAPGAGHTEDELLDALDSCVVAGLLVEPGSGTLRFAHALVRETLYDDVSRMRRSRMHARVADALEVLRPSDLAGLAHHYWEAASAATAAKAVAYARRAAEQAQQRFAHTAAADLWRQALDGLGRLPAASPDARLDLYVPLVRALAHAGNAVAARQARREAVRVAALTGDIARVARAMAAWDVPTAWTTRLYGTVDREAVRWLGASLEHVQDDGTRCRLLWALASELEGEDDPAGAAASLEAVAVARRSGDPYLLVLALNARYFHTLAFGSFEERFAIADELLRLGRDHDIASGQVLGHHVAVQAHAGRGDMARARTHTADALALAHGHSLAGAEWVAALFGALDALVAGRTDEAEATYGVITDGMRTSGAFDADGFAWLTRFVVRHAQGRLADLLDETRAADVRYAEIAPDPYTLVLVASGEVDEARRRWRPECRVRSDYFWTLVTRVRAECAVALGDTATAARCYDALLPYAGLLGGSSTGSVTLGPIAQVLGDVARMRDRPADAVRHYGEALDVARRAGAPHWAAQARDALAALSGTAGTAGASVPRPSVLDLRDPQSAQPKTAHSRRA
ncbi:MAG: BTAD domain-containing putative transcriptional regulator [Actinomycetes bacterium]